MLIDEGVRGLEAARGARRWAAGVLFAMAAAVVLWAPFVTVDRVLEHWSTIVLVSSGLTVTGVALSFFGAWRYVRALPAAFGVWPRILLVALGTELALDGAWSALQVYEQTASLDLHDLRGTFASLSPLFVLSSFLATVASVVVVARVALVIGEDLSSRLVWSFVASQAVRFVWLGLGRLGIYLPDSVSTLLFFVGQGSLYVLLSRHARALAERGTASSEVRSLRDDVIAAWEEPSRALVSHRNALLVQLAVTLGTVLVAMGAQDSTTLGSLLSVAALLGLGVSLLVAVTAWRYAWALPDARAARAAKVGAALLALRVIPALVSTALTLRAYSASGPAEIFETRAWLPVVDGFGRALTLVGLAALLFSFDAVGHALDDRAMPARTRGLKLALVVLAGCVVASQMTSFLGSLAAVFTLAFVVGVLATLVVYLRLVGDVAELLRARAGTVAA